MVRTSVNSEFSMRIDGQCHCGNIAYALTWPGGANEIPARACDCTFCTKHGGVWTSHPDAGLRVSIKKRADVSVYAFGTETAQFHVCRRCGVVPVVTCELDQKLYAVVNVNSFNAGSAIALQRSAATFEDEDVASRLARRKQNWISDVQIVDA